MMYTVDKVVMYERTELYKYKLGSMTPEQVMTPPLSLQEPPQSVTNVEINQQQPKESIRSRLSRAVGRTSGHDPSNPYNLMLKNIDYTQKIKYKWQDILHWYYLGVKKGKILQNDAGLQDLLDNMVIVFDYYVEPNLVMTVRFANEITKKETSELALSAITGYLTAKQRNLAQEQMGRM